MTPQMLHATLSTGQITIWEERLDVTPKNAAAGARLAAAGGRAAGLRL